MVGILLCVFVIFLESRIRLVGLQFSRRETGGGCVCERSKRTQFYFPILFGFLPDPLDVLRPFHFTFPISPPKIG